MPRGREYIGPLIRVRMPAHQETYIRELSERENRPLARTIRQLIDEAIAHREQAQKRVRK